MAPSPPCSAGTHSGQQTGVAEVGEVVEREAGLAVVDDGTLGHHRAQRAHQADDVGAERGGAAGGRSCIGTMVTYPPVTVNSVVNTVDTLQHDEYDARR